MFRLSLRFNGCSTMLFNFRAMKIVLIALDRRRRGGTEQTNPETFQFLQLATFLLFLPPFSLLSPRPFSLSLSPPLSVSLPLSRRAVYRRILSQTLLGLFLKTFESVSLLAKLSLSLSLSLSVSLRGRYIATLLRRSFRETRLSPPVFAGGMRERRGERKRERKKEKGKKKRFLLFFSFLARVSRDSRRRRGCGFFFSKNFAR